MKPSSKAPDHAVLQQAAQWYARLQTEESPQLRADWQQWYAQQDSHQRAWQYVERISARFTPLQEDRDTARATLASARQARQSRRNVLLGLVVLGGGALLARLGWRPAQQHLMAWQADQRTAVGQVRLLNLQDGTRVWLNSSSAVNITYIAQQRLLQLVAGEILIETANDPRPFYVDTAQGRLQALGTRFSVQQEQQDTRLSVFDGSVAIRMGERETVATVVKAGHERRFNRERLEHEQPVSAGRQSWSRGILQADNLALSQIIAELGRHHRNHIGVAPDIAALRVVGTFPLADLDQTLSMLSSALPVRVERPLPWWITLEAKH